MRTSNSIRNSIVAVTVNFFSILIGFISQKLFLSILGAEYLGVNGLFTNILSMLSIADLGIGEAIIFHLYKPVATEDKEKINALLTLYKRAYHIVAVIIFLLGLCVIPWINLFVGKTELTLNFTIIYIIFLLQTSISYLLSYKRSILYAYQKNYIINIIHLVYLIFLNAIQLFFLLMTKNYYLYLIIKVICILLENIIITIFANKLYPFIKQKSIKKLSKELKKDIIARTKAQFFHKIGAVVINATDNIIISTFINILTVGLYSNYYLIISSVKTLFGQLISSITASVGNLLVEEDKEKEFHVYRKIRFLNFWISTFCGICILTMIQSFIICWLGNQYVLPIFVVITLVINMYQSMMRSSNDLFLSAAGICVENRFVPVIESVLNIASSILLVQIFGLAGVFMGTIISSLALWGYSYPKFAYKKIFGRKYSNYAKENIGYFLLFIMISSITFFFCKVLTIQNSYIQMIINGIISLTIPNLLLYLLFRNSDNFQYFQTLGKSMLKKLERKKYGKK